MMAWRLSRRDNARKTLRARNNVPEQFKDLRMSDWKDVKYSRLIMSTERFIVVIDNDGDVDWDANDSFDWDEIDLPKFNNVINRAAALEALPREGLGEAFIASHKRLVAEAIARALDGDPDSGIAMLAEVAARIDARSSEISRRWYLSSCFLTTAVVMTIGGMLWLSRNLMLSAIGPTAFWFLITCVAGALGALFSVIVRSGSLKFESSSGQQLHYLEGFSRIVAGATSGGVAGIAVKTGLILPTLPADKIGGAMMISAVVAGSAERLAQSIISSVDGSAQKISSAAKTTTGSIVSKRKRRGAI
jgi:hypothetical protein